MTSVAFDGAVALIVFDDGGMNLLGSDGLRQVESGFDQAETARASAIVFTSGSDGLFAAGADMIEMIEFSPAEAEEFSEAGQRLMNRIESSPSLTIAVVEGNCFGGALDLLMAFDLRVATPRSRFSHPGSRLGIITGFGGTWRWQTVCDPTMRSRLFLHNEVLSAEEALEGGLLTHVEERPNDFIEKELGSWSARWEQVGPVVDQWRRRTNGESLNGSL